MRKIGSCILFAFLPLSSFALAQSAPAASPAPAAETITLGNSAATLPGPWKFAPGDSPWQNGSPAWAQPGFDDAGWASVNLGSKGGFSRSRLWHARLRARLDGAWLSQSLRLCLVSPARACH